MFRKVLFLIMVVGFQCISTMDPKATSAQADTKSGHEQAQSSGSISVVVAKTNPVADKPLLTKKQIYAILLKEYPRPKKQKTHMGSIAKDAYWGKGVVKCAGWPDASITYSKADLTLPVREKGIAHLIEHEFNN